MTLAKEFEEKVAAWLDVSLHPHRFGGREFLYRDHAEIGHIHVGGVLDIPFPRAIHDALLQRGLAGEHHFVPDSGWTTFRLRTAADLRHALWLMRLSYLRYALKTAQNPQDLLRRESQELGLGAEFQSLLEPFMPRPGTASAA
jgi:hypothetical protein